MSTDTPQARKRIILGRRPELAATTIAFKARPETHQALAQVRGTLISRAETDVTMSLLIGRALTLYQRHLDSLSGEDLGREIVTIERLSGRRWTRKDGRL